MLRNVRKFFKSTLFTSPVATLFLSLVVGSGSILAPKVNAMQPTQNITISQEETPLGATDLTAIATKGSVATANTSTAPQKENVTATMGTALKAAPVNTRFFYYSDDGTYITNKFEPYMGIPTALDAPVKEGYTFIGWYWDGNDGMTRNSVQPYDFTTTSPASNMICLTAQYEEAKGPVVDFYVNGEKTTITQTSTIFNHVVDLPPEPTKDGHTFIGWYWTNSKTGNFEAWDFGWSAPGNRTLSLVAEFKRNEKIVTFDVDGELTEIVQTENLGNKVVDKPEDPEKAGYTFDGWYWDNHSKEVNQLWDFGWTIPVDTDLVLTAKFIKNKTIVTFNVDGELTEIAQPIDIFDTVKEKPEDPTKTGYTFVGWYWYNTATGSNEKWNFENTIPANINLVLNAKFTNDAGLNTVTFIVDGEKVLNEDGEDFFIQPESDLDRLTNLPADPIKEDFKFEGWYWYNSATKEYVKWESEWSIRMDKNLELVAEFSLLNGKNAVIFNVDGEDVISSNGTEYFVQPDAIITNKPEDPTKVGYTFDGWYWTNTKTGNLELWDFTRSSMLENTLVLNAKFTNNLGLNTVVFIVDGEKVLNEDGEAFFVQPESAFDRATNIPEDPTKEDFTFDGWYWTNTKTGNYEKWDFDWSVRLENTLELTAEFSLSDGKNAVIFNVDGEDVISSNGTEYFIQPDETVTNKPEDPTKVGFKFNGWYWNNTKTGNYEKWDFTRSSMLENTLVLIADFSEETINNVNVKFMVEDVELLSHTQVVAVASTLNSIPANPVKEGFDFIGWTWNGLHYDLTTPLPDVDTIVFVADFAPITDNGTDNDTDNGTTDNGTTDNGTTDNGTTDNGTTDNGTTDNGTTDNGTNDNGTNDNGTNDNAVLSEETETTQAETNNVAPVTTANAPIPVVQNGVRYLATQSEENPELYTIEDEFGVALGSITVPEGESIESINIEDELVPLAAAVMPVSKSNPKTGSNETSNTAAVLVVLLGSVLAFVQKTFSRKNA